MFCPKERRLLGIERLTAGLWVWDNPLDGTCRCSKEAEMAVSWDKVEAMVEIAKGIGFDDCHKIYVLLDDEQVEQMKEYGYTTLIEASDTTPNEMLSTIMEWYENSCSLRFVQAVRTNHSDPNAGFVSLIEQGAEWDDE